MLYFSCSFHLHSSVQDGPQQQSPDEVAASLQKARQALAAREYAGSSKIADQSPAGTPALSTVSLFYERFILASAVVLGSYAGVLTRVSFQFERGLASLPSNYTVMYAQLLGSFVLGVFVQFETRLAAANAPLLYRTLYTLVTAGFCGSITSFSTWMYEANKQLFTQFDYSWGSIGTTYDGGRFAEWCVGLLWGILLPLAALNGGMHAAELAKWIWESRSSSPPPRNTPVPQDDDVLVAPTRPVPGWHRYVVWSIPVLCLAATLVVIFVPIAIGWTVFTSVLLFGAAGAYIRYLLSKLNNKPPLLCCRNLGGFPIGTFIVNFVGSLILAAATLVAKFYVSYHDHTILIILYGISTGFCGAMTTMSTFVLEMRRLPKVAAYVYVLTTVILSQLGWVFIYDIQAASLVSTAVHEGGLNGPIDFCPTFQSLCTRLMDAANCPVNRREMSTCDNPFPDPLCRCAMFRGTERLSELTIATQMKGNVSQSLVPIWPSVPDGGPVNDVSSAIDMCLSYQALCDHMLNRINCPHDLRQLNACNRGGLREWVGTCTCGDFSYGDGHVFELIVDNLAYRRYDMLAYGSYAASHYPVDFCDAFTVSCGKHLDHVACPPAGRVIESCTTGVAFDYANYVGNCQCFPHDDNGTVTGWDASERVLEDILDALVKPRWFPLLNVTRPANANGSLPALFDPCSSYEALCNLMLDTIGCPAPLRTGTSCTNDTVWPDKFIGTCECGPLQELTSTRVLEYVIDGMLADDIYNNLIYIPPAMPPFLLAAAYNPFKPLLAPEYPLPGATGV